MLNGKEALQQLLKKEYQKGLRDGVNLMEQKMLLACDNGNPLSINGEVYFIQDAISNLRGIFADLEKDGE